MNYAGYLPEGAVPMAMRYVPSAGETVGATLLRIATDSANRLRDRLSWWRSHFKTGEYDEWYLLAEQPQLRLDLSATLGQLAAAANSVVSPPQFRFGFADLKNFLGDAMGEATSEDYADPNGTGDTLQNTTSGLAFWRKATNTPTFTNGWEHCAHSDRGWL